MRQLNFWETENRSYLDTPLPGPAAPSGPAVVAKRGIINLQDAIALEKQYNFQPHGIQSEGSELRAHVCPRPNMLYVFPREAGYAAVDNNRLVACYQRIGGVDTISGTSWLVRPSEIEGLVKVKIEWSRMGEFFDKSKTTSDKGRLAEQCVVGLIRLGLFPGVPAWPGASVSTSRRIQLGGGDIVLPDGRIVEVKCDLPGGERPGTGNLCLQRSEINPEGRH